ncbi:hypothetical protein ACFRAR_38525 [Kitasatospora sp. NPDC056651]|uniref:hypothetical protein n=1 Tax=Kitasatospora sp. NPDC056651 TaxID=3345892 RepID=UPI003676A262
MPSNSLGVPEFQRYLLKVMEPPTALLEAAVGRIESNGGMTRDVTEQISEMLRLGLGRAAEVRELVAGVRLPCSGRAVIGDSVAERYSLPLWPDFEFEMNFDSSGRHLVRAEFFRSSGPPLPLGIPSPWNFVKSELFEDYDDVRDIDGWGHYETYSALSTESGGRYFFRFSWGLLQEIEEM